MLTASKSGVKIRTHFGDDRDRTFGTSLRKNLRVNSCAFAVAEAMARQDGGTSRTGHIKVKFPDQHMIEAEFF